MISVLFSFDNFIRVFSDPFTYIVAFCIFYEIVLWDKILNG